MSEHIIAAKAALADELVALRGRINRIETAIAVLDGDEPGVPLVRPPAPSVPEPPVTLPKRETRPRQPETRPKPTETRPAAKQGRPKIDRARVADVARKAHAAGESMNQAVMSAFDVATSRASQLMQDARNAGHDIPKSPSPSAISTGTHVGMSLVEQPAPASAPPGERVYACTECDYEIAAVDGAKRDMSSHTIKTHHRGPLADELLAVPKGAAA